MSQFRSPLHSGGPGQRLAALISCSSITGWRLYSGSMSGPATVVSMMKESLAMVMSHVYLALFSAFPYGCKAVEG